MFQRLYNAYGRGVADQMADHGATDGPSSSLKHVDPQPLSSYLPSSGLTTLDFQAGTCHTLDLDQSQKPPIKRSAPGEGGDESSKRVRLSHGSKVPCRPPIDASDSTPLTAYTQSDADDFVAECTQNGIDFDSVIPSFTASGPTPSHDQSSTLTSAPKSSSAHKPAPSLPIDAINTLQEATSDMLEALIRKDADREKQMLVAVGTMRTCLDIHFLPHMEAWKRVLDDVKPESKAKSPVIQERKNVLMVGDLGVPHAIPTGPRGAIADDVRRALLKPLQKQLFEVTNKAQKLEQDAKDKDLEIAKLKAETRRLSNQLISVKTQSPRSPDVPVTNKPDLAEINNELKKTIQSQKEKIKNQNSALSSLEKRWKELKPLPVRQESVEGHGRAQGEVGMASEQTTVAIGINDALVIVDLKRIIEKQQGLIESQASEITKLHAQHIQTLAGSSSTLPNIGKKGRKRAAAAARKTELGQATSESSADLNDDKMKATPISNKQTSVLPEEPVPSASAMSNNTSPPNLNTGQNKQTPTLPMKPVSFGLGENGRSDIKSGSPLLRWQEGDYAISARPSAKRDTHPASTMPLRVSSSRIVPDPRSPWERKQQAPIDRSEQGHVHKHQGVSIGGPSSSRSSSSKEERPGDDLPRSTGMMQIDKPGPW